MTNLSPWKTDRLDGRLNLRTESIQSGDLLSIHLLFQDEVIISRLQGLNDMFSTAKDLKATRKALVKVTNCKQVQALDSKAKRAYEGA